jgi:hypothetical protein
VTGTCPDLLAALKLRQRDLELDAVAVKSRIEEVAELIAILEGPRKRPRKITVINMPRRAGDDDNGDTA